MALQTTAIATSIAGFSVSGVTIRDLDDFQDKVKARAGDLPVLTPAPNYISAPAVNYDSLGIGPVAAITVKYILRYRFLYEVVGAERKLADIMQGWVGKVTAIIDAFIANDSTTEAIHLQVGDITPFGVVTDPAENEFYGCEFGILVTEFVN